MVFLKEFFEKVDFEKNQMKKSVQNVPACKDLTFSVLTHHSSLLSGGLDVSGIV